MQLSILGKEIDKGGGENRRKKRIAGRESARSAEQVYNPRKRIYSHCGDDSGEDPPVLIPNTEVKLSCAEST